ncbi:hypothetical protein BGW36DRAFT_135554 [Talaromyces proteolyticus]|uniref:Uncharacterized protein n=1 Tax=Talaromyces proteolyticus TaxID=1131652 RepID=A0AAD4Q0G1_9EURO|nr:uncharacterized protein BGW36DRAFT_135554 [Talaromyces proteolyticus]KAH8700774.1 hypothetical protein BGW36DRAFT_135554 [Talaromyces proteolyticus]
MQLSHPIFNQLAHVILVSGLKPDLLDVFSVLMPDNPVEFLTIPQRILNNVPIFSNPNIHTILLQQSLTLRYLFKNTAPEEGLITCISGLLGASLKPKTSSPALDLISSAPSIRSAQNVLPRFSVTLGKSSSKETTSWSILISTPFFLTRLINAT